MFKYLGVSETSDGKYDIEIQKRIFCMSAVYGKYKALIFKNRYLSLKNKLSLYTTFVTTVGLYGSATWCLTNDLIADLEAAHFKFLRFIVPGMTPMSSYEDIIMAAAKLGVTITPIECIIKTRFLIFLGHVQRINANIIQNQILHCRLTDGAQCRGAPLMNYRQTISKTLQSFGVNHNEWMKLAESRSSRYKLIEYDGVCYFTKQWLINNMRLRELKCIRATTKRNRDCQINHKIAVNNIHNNTNTSDKVIIVNTTTSDTTNTEAADELFNHANNDIIDLDCDNNTSQEVKYTMEWYNQKVDLYKILYVDWVSVFNSNKTKSKSHDSNTAVINNTCAFQRNTLVRNHKLRKRAEVTDNNYTKFYPPKALSRYSKLVLSPKKNRHFSKHLKMSNTKMSLPVNMDTDNNELVINTNNNTSNNLIPTELDTSGENNSNIITLTDYKIVELSQETCLTRKQKKSLRKRNYCNKKRDQLNEKKIRVGVRHSSEYALFRVKLIFCIYVCSLNS